MRCDSVLYWESSLSAIFEGDSAAELDRFLRRHRRRLTRPASANAPIDTPMPIPALAPLVMPEDAGAAELEGVGDGVAGNEDIIVGFE